MRACGFIVWRGAGFCSQDSALGAVCSRGGKQKVEGSSFLWNNVCQRLWCLGLPVCLLVPLRAGVSGMGSRGNMVCI